MKKLPLGIQSFRKIIEGDYVYVDKTQYIYNLINNASYYFLSRPRRFGKSLLLDTIGEVFGGDKELFKGLWIYDSGYNFMQYPVIRLDMSNISNKTPEILEDSLFEDLSLRMEEERFKITNNIPSDVFKSLIRNLYKKYNQRVVVLIDEYDKSILDHLDDIKIADANRKVLKGFYGILKSMDPYLKFTLLTGVSKFTKTSVFSELNNLMDITFTEEYANICGITHDEFAIGFKEHLADLSQSDNMQRLLQNKNLYDEVLNWYNGYSWDGETHLLNPFSLLSFFSQKRFASFWYASGTPKFLMDLIKKKPAAYTNLKNLKITELMLDSVELDKIEAELLLFQTGYLTIKEVLPVGVTLAYILDIPNFEVKEAFNLQILSTFTESGNVYVEKAQTEIGDALRDGDLQKVLDLLRGLFASIPYNLHIDLEAYYHSIFYAIMSILGFNMEVEVSVSKGRVDAILELEDKVYILEFKYKDCKPEASLEAKRKIFDAALDEGMNQIKDKGYYKKYIGSKKIIYQAAFAFLGRDNIEMRIENLGSA